jgi:hypothetical protein
MTLKGLGLTTPDADRLEMRADHRSSVRLMWINCGVELLF